MQLGEPVLASEGSSLGDGDVIPRRLAVDALLASQVTAEELGEVVGVVGPAAVVAQLLVLGGEPGAVAPLGVLRHRLLVPLRVSSRRDDAGGEEARLASGLPAENHTLEGPQALVEGGGEGVASAVEAGREAIVSDAGSRDGVEGGKAAAGAGKVPTPVSGGAMAQCAHLAKGEDVSGDGSVASDGNALLDEVAIVLAWLCRGGRFAHGPLPLALDLRLRGWLWRASGGRLDVLVPGGGEAHSGRLPEPGGGLVPSPWGGVRRLDPTVGENEVGRLGEVGRCHMIAGCDAVCNEGIEFGRPSGKRPRPPGAG